MLPSLTVMWMYCTNTSWAQNTSQEFDAVVLVEAGAFFQDLQYMSFQLTRTHVNLYLAISYRSKLVPMTTSYTIHLVPNTKSYPGQLVPKTNSHPYHIIPKALTLTLTLRYEMARHKLTWVQLDWHPVYALMPLSHYCRIRLPTNYHHRLQEAWHASSPFITTDSSGPVT